MSEQTEPRKPEEGEEAEASPTRPADYDQQVYDQQKAEKEAANDDRQARLGRTQPHEVEESQPEE